MYSYVAALALAGGASARVLPREQAGCCFQLQASGDHSGTVGQLGDGQNRIGGDYKPATYCLNEGGLTDSNGRGCILTPPTTQFQCDEGATPTTGFSVSEGGEVQYNGSNEFYACGADKGEYNIYTKPVENQDDCVKVTLSSSEGKCSGNGGGSGSGSGSSSAPAESAASTKPAGGASSAAGGAPSSAPAYGQSSNGAAPSSAPAYGQSSNGGAPSSAPAATQPAGNGEKSSAAEKPSQPAAQTSQPAAQTSQPAAQTSQPKPYTGVPKPETSQPAVATSQPKPQESQPAVETNQPKPQESQPAVETNQPKPYASQPSVQTSQAPAVSSQPKPATSQPAQKTSQAAVPSNSGPASYPASSAGKESSAPAGTGSPSISSSGSTGTASGSACQTSLSGAYQTPHLIVPISNEQPDQAYGTNYNGQINSTTSTIFNFDIPQDYEGKQCSIVFLFPKKEDLETSDYTFGGSGSLSCSELNDSADEKTSYSNAPDVAKDLGSYKLQPGNSYVVATQDCKAGETQSIELSSEDGLSLNFFEDWNPSPLGLYITSC